ncbi:hypothetical protein LOAG_07195 [Loa loa]|uniref:SPARC/Testican calcium-binding domain-containing protein n=1 Tax=Loa loa TaxID=7209 RepID=A0A1S0TWJ3_LOALO|nr:hypothetical protein LOAG_07195 [Loa loa]EFO21294.1 hypothetical protein LOAG_07195 [Loa loa]
MCAKKFTKYCDLNKDGEISAREWVTCLGIDISKYAPYFISGNYYFKTIGVFCSLYFKFKFRFWYAMVCGDDECEDKETDDLRSKVKSSYNMFNALRPNSSITNSNNNNNNNNNSNNNNNNNSNISTVLNDGYHKGQQQQSIKIQKMQGEQPNLS